MKRIEYIDKQGSVFRFKILGIDCALIKTSMYVGNDLFPKPAVVKGSTLGWNFSKEFVSYNQIKKEIKG
jgi:hypothetical protein